jgi:phospholipid transport system transporter-binding protein
VSPPSLTNLGGGCYKLTGDLDFSSVAPLAAEGERLFAGAEAGPKPLNIDLAGVGQANSAGLALLLEWLDQAQGRGLALRFTNCPNSLARIAAITNLTGLVPCGHETAPNGSLNGCQ